jgi:hypothetical protein
VSEGQDNKQQVGWKAGVGQSYFWLTPIILATWEAEIKRIAVPSQPGEIVCKTPSPK